MDMFVELAEPLLLALGLKPAITGPLVDERIYGIGYLTNPIFFEGTRGLNLHRVPTRIGRKQTQCLLVLAGGFPGKRPIASIVFIHDEYCLLYTSPSPRDGLLSRMPSSA